MTTEERVLIALKKNNWSRVLAAEALGFDPTAMRYYINKLLAQGIEVKDPDKKTPRRKRTYVRRSNG